MRVSYIMRSVSYLKQNRDTSILSQAYEMTLSSQLSMRVVKQYGLKAARLMVSGKWYDSESSK